MAHTKGRNKVRRERGFTLIEAAYTTIILGIGVVAMVDAQQSFLLANGWSNESSTGAFLAGEVREFMRALPNHDPVTGLFFDDTSGSSTLTGWGPEDGEVVVTDFDDVDDFDGILFTWVGTPDLSDGDLPGPINAFGETIPRINFNGDIVDGGGVVVATLGEAAPLQGWSQSVEVEKVLPHDTYPDPPLPNDYVDAYRKVNQFPLRVTVTVFNQRPEDAAPREVTSMTWIMP